MRIQRALARAGVASRRHSEELIAAGRVTVNGKPAQIGQSVDPARDDIRVDGKQVEAPSAPVWILLNKPKGVMTTRSDPEGRQTVFQLVDDVPGLTYVGRLDYETEGLLLLTTDGTAANQLTHPSFEVEREYLVTVRGDVDAAVAQARRGVELDDGPVRPREMSARKLRGGQAELSVTITEGRKREVRRFCNAIGLKVERLVRVRYGPIKLGSLATGDSRPLTATELQSLDRFIGQSSS